MKPRLRYFNAAAAAVLVTPAAADVIYSDLQDIAIPATYDGVYLNVETGASNTDMFNPVAGWDINPYFGGSVVWNSPSFQPVRSGTGELDSVLNLDSGTIVSGSSVFSTFVQGPSGNDPGGPGFGGSDTHLGASPGQFGAGDEGFLGFRLNGTDYGWMRVVFTNNTGGALIKDWAYNTGGGSIATGNVIQSGSTYTLDSTTQDFALGSAITGSNSLVKNGANTVTLNNNNTFSGTTSINTGTLAIGSTGTLANTSTITVASGATLDVSAVGGGWTLGASQTLTGSGGVTGNVTIAGIHNAGDPATNSGVGSQAFTGDLTYANGSIFGWDINQSSTSTGFDLVSATGAITASSSAVFHVVLGDTVLGDLGNAFWNNAPYATQAWDLADIFGQSLAGAGFGSVTTSTNVSAYGSFSINSSTLTWTAIPEPTSALAGLLLTAAMLRRRRDHAGL